MPSIVDAAILRRARGLCEADRLAWDYSAFIASRGRGSLKGVIDEEARRDYLTRARAIAPREQHLRSINAALAVASTFRPTTRWLRS